MDALVMAGGRGTRLDADVEKPLFEVEGVAMIDRVLGALERSDVGDVVVATSPVTPETGAHVAGARGDVEVVETPGEGYVADLQAALEATAIDEPLLTVAADLPLLSADVVDRVVSAHHGGPLTVAIPVPLKEALGVSVDETPTGGEGGEADRWVPVGLNVVAEGEDELLRSWDVRLAVNVNRVSDAEVASLLANPRKNYPA